MMSSWNILKKVLKEEEIVRYSNSWNTTSFKPQMKKIKDWNNKKREVRKEEAPVASTRNPQVSQAPQEEKKKKWRKQDSPSYRIPRLQKRFHEQCLQNGQNLHRIQGQRGANNETTPFLKEITLSPDVLNTLAENKNSILPLKEIKNDLLSLQEINSSLLYLTQIVVQNKKEIDKFKFIVENNKPKVLIYNTHKLTQRQQQLYKYIKDTKEKTLKINYDMSIDNMTENMN
ncbi:hypothetical protein O181_085381 [Austropuccinia psidii MF-1]|uniref:Uncharacterized protein n=1 Tax=Austropuccinia psidii MF-1 TaxID=1389203 RepID=A0A9Q3IJP8_9BASI|nr:hypothetical protein [Austropuccinia psidii MF-1]